MYRANDDHLVHRIDVTSPDVAFPLSGSNRRTVTFKFDFSFVIGTRYYLLFQGGKVYFSKNMSPVNKKIMTFIIDVLDVRT